MAARITPAEARRLGLTPPATTAGRTTRRTARGPYRTRCTTCGEQFTTVAGEDRHVVATRHVRYQLEMAAP